MVEQRSMIIIISKEMPCVQKVVSHLCMCDVITSSFLDTVPVFRYHCNTIPDTVEVSVRYQRCFTEVIILLTDCNAGSVEAINDITSNVG
jgi:hypothetical protein